MKLAIIKWIIGWLVNNHKYLLMEAVIPEGKHLGWNPGRKPKTTRVLTEEAYRDEQDIMEQRGEVDIP